MSGFQRHLQRLNESIIQDFGGSGLNISDSESDGAMDNQEASSAHSGGIDTELGITAEEFPWALTPVQNTVGEAGGLSRAERI